MISVVIPFRNRTGIRLFHCLVSLRTQTIKPNEIIISDYGSTYAKHKDLMYLVNGFNTKVIYTPTDDVWSRSKAINIGIRHTDSKSLHVLIVDIDLILERNFLKELQSKLDDQSFTYVIPYFLQEPPRSYNIPFEFESLLQRCTRTRWKAYGCVCLPRKWLFKVRGYDERMKIWGAEDNDIVKRAELSGLKKVNISSRIIHQWHPDSLQLMKEKYGEEIVINQVAENRRIYTTDNSIVRNDANWGLTSLS